VVNHAGRAFVPEALRILSEGIAEPATIDRILVDAAGFRLGPFGLMDLVGLDVNHAVMKSLYQQYFEEPKYKPSFLVEPRVAAGLLGRKTKRGWFEYAPELKMPAEPPAPATWPASIWAVPELRETLQMKSEASPANAAVCFVAPLGRDCTTAALQYELDPARTVAVDPLRAVVQLVEAAPQKADVVRGPVPGVGDGAQHGIADDRATRDAQARAVDPALSGEPLERQQQRHHRAGRADGEQEPDAEPLPSLARRKPARRAALLEDEQHEVRGRNRQADQVDGLHSQRPSLTV
jgi:hypothetical protein